MKQAMLLAAGMGTRLKPLTDHTPKALIPVGGDPLLKTVLLRFKASGFQHIVINVHHFAQQITKYLADNQNFGLHIQISDETPMLLETGGALKHAQTLFSSSHPILIHNVDILSNVALDTFYSSNPLLTCPSCGVPHEKALATLLVSSRSTTRYLIFNAQMRLVGWIHTEKLQIKSPYPEIAALQTQLSPQAPLEQLRMLGLKPLAFSGIHTFSPELFSEMESYPERFPIIDFYLDMCRKHPIKGIEYLDLKLLDVGKLNTLEQAELFYRQLQ